MQGREAVDSMVCENKADSRSPGGERLSLEGTLENLLEIKLHNPEETSPCLKFNPNENLLSSAKKKKNSKRSKSTKQGKEYSETNNLSLLFLFDAYFLSLQV